jgi:DNA transformation protein
LNNLTTLKNLGPTILKNLESIGIKCLEDLKKIGPVGVYKKLQKTYPNKTWPVCYYLYSIEGALTGKHWDKIGKKRKDELLREVGIQK